MKQTINQTQFINAFTTKYSSKDNFSYEGLVLLFDWLEDYEADTGEEVELDVVAICCDFSEMSLDDVVQAYDIKHYDDDVDFYWDDLTDEERVVIVADYLSSKTSFIGYTENKTFVFAQW
tara:strand:- start:69 stop:428 length:360 start_codon:yes stop_codon:yes gene_type:complete